MAHQQSPRSKQPEEDAEAEAAAFRVLQERTREGAASEALRSEALRALKGPAPERWRALVEVLGIARRLGGALPVRYSRAKGPGPPVGRLRSELLVEGREGLPTYAGMPRGLRSTLAAGVFWDVDMVNCAPTLLLQTLRRYGVGAPLLARYVEEREARLAEVEAACGVTRREAKGLFLRLAFLGTCEGWATEASEEEADAEEEARTRLVAVPGWVRELEGELRDGAGRLLAHGDFAYARREGGTRGCQLARAMQTEERRCLEALVEAVDATGRGVGALIHDGLLVERATGEAELPGALLREWERAVAAATGHEVGLEVKALAPDPAWGVAPGSWAGAVDPVAELEREETSLLSYEELKAVWERSTCKVVQNGLYVQRQSASSVLYTRARLVDAYEHLACTGVTRREGGARVALQRQAFLQGWLQDPGMRTFRTMDVLPPPRACPPTTYNLWSGFEVEAHAPASEGEGEGGDPWESAGVRAIVGHLSMLVHGDAPTLDYVLDWMAHMFQRPGEKPGVALVLVGPQGAGKNVATDVLKHMMGLDKCLQTAKPNELLYGRFTEPRRNKVCIVVDEARGADQHAAADLLKDIITCETFQCEAKGRDPVPLLCFARLIFTTNNLNAVKVTGDDRRFVVLSVSAERVGDGAYFRELVGHVRDPHARHAFYRYLMGRDVSRRDWSRDRPITAYFRHMVDMSLDYEYAFLRDAVLLPAHRDGRPAHLLLRRQAADLFADFVAWLERARIRHDTNEKKFGHKLSALASPSGPDGGSATATATTGGLGATTLAGAHRRRTARGTEYVFDVPRACADMVAKRWLPPEDLLASALDA